MTNSAGKIFHSNDNYSIVVNDDMTAYHVVNDASGVVEFTSESLPECIFAAENLNVVLVHRTYEWVAKRAREQSGDRAGLASVTDLN